MAVKKIIACADIHFPSLRGIEELKAALNKFLEHCRKIVEEEGGAENVRIAVLGDIFHNKNQITNESILAVSWFFRELGKICKTIVIIGNHDLLMNNLDRTDSLTPLFEIGEFDNVVYLDKEVGYKSGCLQDDNIVWCVYSSFSGFEDPDIKSFKREHTNDNLIYAGMIHGDINGAMTPLDFVSENGLDKNMFNDCDFVMAGHIHKRQEITTDKGVKIVYCSSITQKDFGETVKGHGYVVWNVEDKDNITYECVDLPNEEGGYYKFTIDNIDDIDNDKEVLVNFKAE